MAEDFGQTFKAFAHLLQQPMVLPFGNVRVEQHQPQVVYCFHVTTAEVEGLFSR